MKISKLLNRKNFLIFLIIFLSGLSLNAEEEPDDIWNIDKKKLQSVTEVENVTSEKTIKTQTLSESDIFNMQSKKKNSSIESENVLDTKQIKIVGLYDPDNYGLDMNIWVRSDGDQLKNIISNLKEIDLSNDATELMNISMLTNSYYPTKNITEKEFLKFKSDWLIKNSDLDLIEKYLVKNQIIAIQPKLTRYLIDQYLSQSKLDKACEVFSKNRELINDDYLSRFNIYCLVDSKKIEEAQLILDLKKELGFKNLYFEKKLDYLMGLSPTIDEKISEKSILNFHLGRVANPKFSFEPNETTSKIIWKYLTSYNLLDTFKEIQPSDLDRISNIEKAVNNKNYPEKDLLNLYKRFQFNINQLLNAEISYKSLSNIEARALIYQKILLESEMVEKLKLLKILKSLFKNDKIDNAFDVELKIFLAEVDPLKIPDNLTSFYYTNIEIKKDIAKKIKFNNDVLHQSKLINYFNGDYSKSKIEKDINNFLRKIKKNKKYFLSKKDKILLASLKSDGIKIDKKYDNLYETNDSEMPTDIQVLINNDEKGAVILRIVEVIGQDKLERIDDDTIYFIINALNQLNIDVIRNKILLKVLPLKV